MKVETSRGGGGVTAGAGMAGEEAGGAPVAVAMAAAMAEAVDVPNAIEAQHPLRKARKLRSRSNQWEEEETA
jgi:hypothetical protein